VLQVLGAQIDEIKNAFCCSEMNVMCFSMEELGSTNSINTEVCC
jgi:hypothetical protein